MIANTGLFIAYLYLEHRYTLFGLSQGYNPLAYACAIPLAVIFAIPYMKSAYPNMVPASIWASLGVAFRLMGWIAVLFAGIYFFLKDTFVSRLFLLSFLPAGGIFNFLLAYFAPVLISRASMSHGHSSHAIIWW